MIKVYQIKHKEYVLYGIRYAVVSESGVWEHYLVSEMIQEEVIEWFHCGRRVIKKNMKTIEPKEYPRWLKYFLDKYSWMFNDPLSWKRDGFNDVEVRIPYKWKVDEDYNVS